MTLRRGATVVGMAVCAAVVSAFVDDPRAQAQTPEPSARAVPGDPGETAWALRFSAPVECGDGGSFRQHVSDLLRSRELHADGLVVAVSIEREAGAQYQLALQVETSVGPAQRQLQADNCEALVRAAAAIVAFSLSDSATPASGELPPASAPNGISSAQAPTADPTSAAATEPSPLPEAVSNPTETPEAPRSTERQGDEETTEQAEETPNDAESSRDDASSSSEATGSRAADEASASPAVWFLVGSKFDSGLLPSGAVSGRIGAGWGDGVGLQSTISGGLASATSSAAQLPEGRRFLRYSLEAQLSYLWSLTGRVSAGPALSLDVALVTASGAQGQPGATSTALGVALGGAAEVAITRGLRLRPEAELLIAARRAQFDTWEATARDPVWIAPRFGARAGLALMATF